MPKIFHFDLLPLPALIGGTADPLVPSAAGDDLEEDDLITVILDPDALVGILGIVTFDG